MSCVAVFVVEVCSIEASLLAAHALTVFFRRFTVLETMMGVWMADCPPTRPLSMLGEVASVWATLV